MRSSENRLPQSNSVTRYTYRNRAVDVPDDHLAVGRIIAPHGNRGEARVELHTDYPERFYPDLVVYMGTGLDPLVVETVRPHKGHLLIRFAGVYNRDAAEVLRDQWIFVHETSAVELEDDTYFIHQLVGLRVVTTDGRELGRITDVLSTGANDVYIVAPAPGVTRNKELLVPAIAQVVQVVDLAGGTMTIELMDGLLG